MCRLVCSSVGCAVRHHSEVIQMIFGSNLEACQQLGSRIILVCGNYKTLWMIPYRQNPVRVGRCILAVLASGLCQQKIQAVVIPCIGQGIGRDISLSFHTHVLPRPWQGLCCSMIGCQCPVTWTSNMADHHTLGRRLAS